MANSLRTEKLLQAMGSHSSQWSLPSWPQGSDFFEYKSQRPRVSVAYDTFRNIKKENPLKPGASTLQAAVRNAVNYPMFWPNCAHGLITFKLDGKKGFASGTLIAPNFVLTAAHNLYSASKKVYSTNIIFYPGLSQEFMCYGKIEVDTEDCFVPEEYQNGNENEDYGGIFLNTNIGEKTGYYGVNIASDTALDSKGFFQVTGYPDDVNLLGEMWECTNLMHFNHKVSVGPKDYSKMWAPTGNIGAGLFYEENGNRYVVAVVGEQDKDPNYFYSKITRLTKDRYIQMYQWVQQKAQNLCKEQSLNSLRELNLRGKSLIASDIKWLSQFGFDELQKVDLSRNSLGDAEVKLLVKNACWYHLQQLHLSENNIGEEGAKVLAESITWKLLTNLNLSKNNIGDNGVEYLSRNQSWVNLKSLDLSKNNIGDKGVKELAQSVIKVSVQNPKTYTYYERSVPNKPWKELTFLNLSGNNIRDNGVIELGKNQTWDNLTSLNLSGNQIGDNGLQGFPAPNVTVFDKQDPITGDDLTKTISNPSWVNLKSLDLSRNNIGDNGVQYLSKTWIKPTSLDLSQNKIGDAAKVKSWSAEAFWNCLHRLNLSSNHFQPKGMEDFVDSKNCTELEYLDPSINNIDQAGLNKLINNPTWQKLRFLNLSFSGITQNAWTQAGFWTGVKVVLANNVVGCQSVGFLSPFDNIRSDL